MFFAAGILFLISFSIHYEYGGDVMFAQYFRGTLMGVKLYNFYYYEVGWSYLFIFLYGIMPSIPWHGAVITFLSASTFLLLLHLLWRLAQAVNLTAIISVLFVLAFVLWSRSFFWISFSRLPVIACGLILIYMALHGAESDDFRIKSFHYLICLGYFVLNACFRLESAILATFMVLPSAAYLLHRIGRSRLALKIPLLILPLMVSSAVLLANQFITQSDEHLAMKKMVALHFDFYDAGKVNYSLASSGATDSIKLEAMLKEFTPDKQQFPPDEYERFLSGRLLSTGTLHEWRWRLNKVAEFCSDMLTAHRAWLLTYFLLLLIVILLAKRFKDRMRILLFQLVFIVMILGIVFFLKAAERVHEPMLTLAGFLLLFDLIYIEHENYAKALRVIFSIIAVIAGLVIFIHIFKWFDKMDHYDSETEKFHAEILADIYSKMENEKKTIVFTAPAFELFRMNPLKEFRIADESPIWTYDTHLTYIPGYDALLMKLTGSTTFTGFYAKLSSLGQNALIVSNHERMQLISEYSLQLYQFKIEYGIHPDVRLHDLSRNRQGLSYYYIKAAYREPNNTGR